MICVYDMDRTVTRRGSWVPWLWFWVRHVAYWRLLLAPLLLPALLFQAVGWIDRGRLKAIAQRLMMGNAVPRQRLDAMARAFAENFVAHDVFPGALDQIAVDGANGCHLVLATASNEFYVAAIAARLGFHTVIATPARWENALLRSRAGGANCYGAEKSRRVDAWLASAGFIDRPIRVYSDHVSDLPLFELAIASGGEAVATNASAALRRIAVARGWRLVDWGVPAGSLFERA